MTSKKLNVFNYVAVGICVIDSNYEIICWNNSLAQLTNIEPEEAIGKYLYDLYPEFQKRINLLRIKDVASGGPPAIFSASLNKTLFAPILKIDPQYYYEIIASSLPIENEESNYIIFTVEDKTALYKKVSDYKQVKDLALIEIEQRKIVEESLKLANQSKDKFISIMAHDIKNPLGVIQSVSDFLMKSYEELNKDELKEFLNGMYHSSKKLNELINDLLIWARSQSGKLTISKTDINLKDLINDEVNLLYNTALNKSIELLTNVDDEIIINLDKNMIQTTLRNLISNAIKFTYNGGKVSIGAVIQDGYCVVSVVDNGIGISETNKLKLFNLGESITTQGTNEESGTGLGLLLCKEFIELHKGKIWLESELGKGSKFYFSIPISQS